MRGFFISKNYADQFTASSKAKCDCEDILLNLGLKNIGLPRKFFTKKIFGINIGRLYSIMSYIKAMLFMPKISVCYIQFPTAFEHKLIDIAKRRKNKVVVIIHDINSLRENLELSSLKMIEKADFLIVHTENMKNLVSEVYPNKRIFTLGCFDYLLDEKKINLKSQVDDKILFAGNLGKSYFLKDVDIDMNLYGIGFDEKLFSKKLEYKGCFHPSVLPSNLNGKWGLVWDGTSTETCDGMLGEYLKFIAPHKFSLYIACEIPVIVWNKSAMADYVVSNQIGICVEDLKEDLYRKISSINYEDILTNVKQLAKIIRVGKHLENIVMEIEKC